jgi:tRNA-dihydrouridine synthase
MTKGFWSKLKKPIMVMAPMADVTDCAFRKMIAQYGKPDVLWTEFVSSDGLCSPGREVLKRDLEYGEGERPIVAQLFTSHPEKMFEAAKLVKELGFDGLDINMGCPDKSVEKQGAGAAHMKDPERAKEVIKAAQEGASGIPVTVKTRIGYNKDEIDTWIPELLSCGLPVLTVHLRTRKEMSDVPAHWDLMKRVVELRNKLSPEH